MLFVPIIILLFIVAVPIVIYVGYYANVRKSVPHARPNWIYRIVGIYMVVLGIVAIVYLGFIQPKLPVYDSEEAEQQEKEWESVGAAYSNMQPEYLYEQREIAVKDDIFYLKTTLDEGEIWEQGVTILIEKTDDKADIITVKHYRGQSDVSVSAYIDISNMLSPREFLYEGDSIEIVENKDVESIHLTIIEKSFIYRQFKGESTPTFDLTHGHGMGSQNEVLHLSVPKHIEVVVDDVLEELVDVNE